jgi:hypothetical protein
MAAAGFLTAALLVRRHRRAAAAGRGEPEAALAEVESTPAAPSDGAPATA